MRILFWLCTFIASLTTLVITSDSLILAANNWKNRLFSVDKSPEPNQKNNIADNLSDESSSLDPKVDILIKKGRASLDAFNLTTPKGDNAKYYFNLALELAPSNRDAQSGIDSIVDKYLELANNAILSEDNNSQAQVYIDRGLSIAPNNKNLLRFKNDMSIFEQRNLLDPKSIETTQGPRPEEQAKKLTALETYDLAKEESSNRDIYEKLIGSWEAKAEKIGNSGTPGYILLTQYYYHITFSPDQRVSATEQFLGGMDECPFKLQNRVMIVSCDGAEIVRLTPIFKSSNHLEIIHKTISFDFNKKY